MIPIYQGIIFLHYHLLVLNLKDYYQTEI